MWVRLHPWASASVDVYVPGTRSETTIWPPSPIEPATAPLNEKLPDALSGAVCFSTMIVARFVFVKMQVTVSPACSEIDARGALVRAHGRREIPAGRHVLGHRVGARVESPESFDWPSASEKPPWP